MERTVRWVDQDGGEGNEGEGEGVEEEKDDKDFQPANNANSSVTESSPKLRRSKSLFGKLRNSLLPLSRSRRSKLHRSLSLDAGLQKRIDQLAEETVVSGVTSQAPSPETSPTETVEPALAPRIVNNLRESIMDVPEEDTTDLDAFPLGILASDESTAFDETFAALPTAIPASPIQSFACAWLAPTEPPHLFQGQLILVPSQALLFHGQRFNRQVRLRFKYSAILNLSRGGWNGGTSNAIIIDLLGHGAKSQKQKQWIFVNWTTDAYRKAEQVIVADWKRSILDSALQVRSTKAEDLERKHSKIARHSETSSLLPASPFKSISRLLKAWLGAYTETRPQDSYNPVSVLRRSRPSMYAADSFSAYDRITEHPVLVSCPPAVLRDILMERATGFMRNLRAMLGTLVLNEDEAIGNDEEELSRHELGLVVKVSGRAIKLLVTETVLEDEPDRVVVQAIYQLADAINTGVCYRLYFVAERRIGAETDIPSATATHQNPQTGSTACAEEPVPIDSLPSSSLLPNLLVQTSLLCYGHLYSPRDKERLSQQAALATLRKISGYAKAIYIPQMMPLLVSLVREAEIEHQKHASADEQPLNPTARFLFASIQQTALTCNLGLTVCVLPWLWKRRETLTRIAHRAILFTGIILFLSLAIRILRTDPKPRLLADELDTLLTELTDASNLLHSLSLHVHRRTDSSERV